jgi:hypothetical protein
MQGFSIEKREGNVNKKRTIVPLDLTTAHAFCFEPYKLSPIIRL